MALLDTAQYEFIRRLVYDQSRINLGPDKAELVSARLGKRMRALQIDEVGGYFELLHSAEREAEIPHLLDVISTNVTEFFREADHFVFLREVVLPEWRKGRGQGGGKTFRVWSAACSSGEEPYTIAIVLAEYFRDHPGHRWQIVASDISTRMIEKARQAIYAREKVKLPNPDWLRRYFQKGVGDYAGSYRLKEELRGRVQFQHLNLISWPYPFTEPFDAVFCRNVMIYFDRSTQAKLLPQLRAQLTPDGYLFTGHSESLIGADRTLKCVRPSIYRHG